MAIKHTIRTEYGTAEVSLTPLQAIKRTCCECMGFVKSEVEKCTSLMCPLYPFRKGKSHSGRKGNPHAFGNTMQDEENVAKTSCLS